MPLNHDVYPPISRERPVTVLELSSTLDPKQFVSVMRHDDEYYLIDASTISTRQPIGRYSDVKLAIEDFLDEVSNIANTRIVVLNEAPDFKGSIVSFAHHVSSTPYRVSVRVLTNRFKLFANEGTNRRAGGQKSPVTRGNYLTQPEAIEGFKDYLKGYLNHAFE